MCYRTSKERESSDSDPSSRGICMVSTRDRPLFGKVIRITRDVLVLLQHRKIPFEKVNRWSILTDVTYALISVYS